jgi:hypothetical protein
MYYRVDGTTSTTRPTEIFWHGVQLSSNDITDDILTFNGWTWDVTTGTNSTDSIDSINTTS